VTGSGKTEVYLNGISAALESGRSALMLVPEIGLTPQTARYFREWFGEDAAILHSGLSNGERFDQWRRIRDGRARVVVGTRSAIFAPLANLGLIVIDEEHDASYKQEELPRYHARDTALKRAQLEKAVVVLGSATPQLETFFLATEGGRHRYEPLRSRVLERPLPTVRIVDMRAEFAHFGRGAIISQLLQDAVRERLRRKEQTLILLNRRGYSPLLICRSCGQVESCENCSISLTFHQESNRLSCHYCGYTRQVPARCRECGKEYIYFVGEGTERVEEVLGGLFPEAAVARMDRDTTHRKGSLARILSEFAAGRVDILVGTQMIAKGHDFPRVTLVGVLAADRALRLADFRAAERTFQLLTQVAGRSGRGERPGEVIIQTYYPEHYCLRHACAQDYDGFFGQELKFRRSFRYPPLTALANLFISSRDADEARKLSEELARLLNRYRDAYSSEERMRILGPAAAALERLKKDYRRQILIKTTHRGELHRVLEAAVTELRKQGHDPKAVAIDVDPLNLL
jgi:primosomal protein N' (replication factor Y)